MVSCVLHCDVDAFFCQVEVLRNPSLGGIPLAVQQHQDVIAVNYAARQAGVKKHMAPAQARQVLAAAGGRLVHVFCEEGLRVSYRPYRETSAAFTKLLQRFVNAAVVERASIDEAFILCQPPGSGSLAQPLPSAAEGAAAAPGVDAAAAAGSGPPGPAGVLAGVPGASSSWDASLGARLAGSIREACAAELGLQVSVGVAPNKLLAKLASRAAKPDGTLVLDSTAAVQKLLQRTPVDKLPGMGGQVAAMLTQAGATTVSDLQAWPWPQLLGVVGGQHKLAGRLWEWCWGRDAAPVADKGPSKSIQVQMSLTPQLMPLPPSVAARPLVGQPAAAAGEAAAPPPTGGGPSGQPMVLQPLCCASPDTMLRLRQVMGAMLGDLLSRVLLDRHTEDRWPRKLALTLATSGPAGRSSSRSCGFPTPALVTASDVLPTAPAQQAAAPGDGSGGGEGAQGGEDAAEQHPAAAAVALPGSSVVGERSYAVGQQLQEAVLNLLMGLAQGATAGQTPANAVVQLNICVSNFTSYEAAASASIRSFFNPVQHGQAAAVAAGGGAVRGPPGVPSGSSCHGAEQQAGIPRNQGHMGVAAVAREAAPGVHGSAATAAAGGLDSNRGDGAPQQRLMQAGAVQGGAGAVQQVGHCSSSPAPSVPAAAAAHTGAASIDSEEDVILEDANPPPATEYVMHSADDPKEHHQRSRAAPRQALNQRPSSVAGRPAHEQRQVHSLPQPSVARQAQAAVGPRRNPHGPCIQLSSMLLQLANPEYSAEAAKQDFSAWDAALSSG